MGRVNLAHRIATKQDRMFDRIRDPAARGAASRPGTGRDLSALSGAEYALVVTFRRSGEAVPTPMWFGLYEGRAYAKTLSDAGKVTRLRRDPHVRIAPCTVRGKPTGPFAEATGRILEPAESELAESVLDGHYGRRRRLYEGLGTKLGVQSVYIEITPGAEDTL
jgi:PPOX class probable F420-dependent enzyme